MRFFDNSTINRTYIHAALQTFAANAGGVFVFVYLLKAGISAPIVFCTMASIFLLRIIMRQSVLPLVKKVGLRNGLIIGTLLTSIGYLIVAGLQGLGPLFVVFILVEALGTSIYWTCHHAYVAKLGDPENRGAQVSAREAINATMGIIAPLVGSYLLVFQGSSSAFIVAAIIEALAIIPLLSAPNFRIPLQAINDLIALKYAGRLFFTDGAITAAFFFTWIIALFQSLGGNFGTYGGTLALAGLVGAGMSLGVGRMIDLGQHKRSVQIAYSAIAISLIFKAVSLYVPWTAVAAHAFGAVAAPLYMPVLMSRVYNMTKSAACPVRFQISTEGAWDLGVGLGCLLVAALTWAGVFYSWPILLGLLACGAGYKLMQNGQSCAS